MSLKRLFPLFLLLLTLMFGGCALTEPQPTPTPEPEILPEVCFSEVMSANRASFALDDGSFPDWVELYNAGTETAELAGFTLRCGGKDWLIPALTLEPGAYRLVFCDGAEGEEHAPFTLSRSGVKLALLSSRGTELDSLTVPKLEEDTSFARFTEGFAVTDWPSPGFENNDAGYTAFQDSRACPDGLAIGEAMVYNARFPDENGAYYDWVELTNFSARTIELSDYALSDKGSDRLLYPLPAGELQPGESRVVYCDKDRTGEHMAPFGLSSSGETLYLSRADGTLCDYVSLRGIPLGCSMGRERGRGGFFYFAEPTPGSANAEGARQTGVMPEAVTPDGVYDDAEELRVELRGEGTIHITTDGSVPTEDSPVYLGPITLSETTVIRAVSFQPGHLPSEPLSLSYFLREEHSLPVVSLVGDPDAFFDKKTGFYTNPSEKWEVPACVMVYEDGESLRLDCGVKLHGATSRFAQEKKSMKLLFRDRYAGPLHADFFHNGVTEFDSLILRAAQESDQSTLMRDTLMHQLSLEAYPDLPAQDYHYCVLYINGAYWGVYNLREAHSAGHYARHFGYDADTISQWQEEWPKHSVIAEVYAFTQDNDLRKDENYAYVASHLDVKSVADWCIMQVYSGNFDFNPPNMRFYYSTEDELLRYALVDLDLGMFSYGSFGSLFGYGYAYTNLANYLLRNAGFRDLLLSELKRGIEGPLADEAVIARIDALADELRPEIARDRERWGGDEKTWERMVEHLREYIRMNKGRAVDVVVLLRESRLVPSEEMEVYFPHREWQ